MVASTVVLCSGRQEGGQKVKYKAEISFISRVDLFTEIDLLIRDLRRPNGFVDPPKRPERA